MLQNSKPQEQTTSTEKVLKDIYSQIVVQKENDGSIEVSWKDLKMIRPDALGKKHLVDAELVFSPNVDEKHGPLLQCKIDHKSLKVSEDGKTATIDLITIDKVGVNDRLELSLTMKDHRWSPEKVKMILSDGKNMEGKEIPILPNAESVALPSVDPKTRSRGVEIPVLNIGTDHSSAPHSVAAAFRAIENEGGLSAQGWKAGTEQGNEILSTIKTVSSQLDYLPDDMIKSKGAVGDPKPVNDFLKENGFNVELSKSTDSGLYGASVFSAKGTFPYPGKKSEITLESGKEVPAAKLEASAVVNVYKAEDHSEPIIALETKEGLTAYVTEVGTQGAKGNVMEFVEKVAGKMEVDEKYNNITGVNIPMADYQASGDMKELLGMSNGTNQIDQAKYGHSFKMDENGFDAKAFAALGASRGIEAYKKEITVNSEYVVWISTDRKIIPFAARISESDMKDPGR